MPLAWLLAVHAALAGATSVGCSTADHEPDAPASAAGSASTAAPADDARSPRLLDPDVQASVRALDAATVAHWRAAGVDPVDEADDATMVRRLTLDLTGRIPTPAQLDAWLSPAPSDGEREGRREALVEALLGDPAFAEHWADVLTDALLDGVTDDRPRVRRSLHAWLEQQLGAEARWDAMTTQMLTARGTLDEASPAGFVVAHGRGDRVETLTAQTGRLFLGAQVRCAQCHDDPDDRFTQAQFYGLAAAWARTRTRVQQVDGVRTIRLVDKPRGEMRMPTDYDAPGDRSGARVAPEFPGLTLQPAAGQTRREALAASIVASPRFDAVTVNLVWRQLMGRGIVEPWDDLGGATESALPPLLEQLAADFRAHDHDLRHLVRTIVHGTAYRRSAEGDAAGTPARVQAFAQAAVRPMSPSQLLRSLLVATGLHDARGRAFRRAVEQRRREIRQQYALVFDDDEMRSADAFTGTVPQALLLLNGALTNEAVDAPQGTVARVLDSHADPDARVDALFMRIYGHPPDAARREALVDALEARGDAPEAYHDLAHAMLVSSEFLTIH